MTKLANFPLELLYHIALHLPFTKDVLAFSLTHSRVREALSTPALFKERLSLRGWDLSAWLEEDSKATVSRSPEEDLERWMRIDHVYCRATQLFDEAAADNYFLGSPPDCDAREPEPEQPDDIVAPQSTDQTPVPLNPSLDKEKTIGWLQKLNEVLPVFLTHHRGGNVSRITEARHRGALLTHAKVLTSIYSFITPRRSSISRLRAKISTSEYPWLERSCFCLIALLMQCDTNMVTSTFSDPVLLADSRDLFSAFMWNWETDSVSDILFTPGVHLDPYALPDTMTEYQKHQLQLLVSERYFFAFLIQSMIFMTLCSDTSLPLCAPSLPYINPASSFSFDQPSMLQRDTSFPFWLKPPPRPWLQNRPAGTPLAELLSSADNGDDSDGRRGCRPWAGYYVVRSDVTDNSAIDPPMFLELCSIKGPIDPLPFSTLEPDLSERINFQGEGHDRVGAFTLQGYCNMHTGAVTATKAYATHAWPWRGMVTPFGMAGIWGRGFHTGWWWIWPREWSGHLATTGPD